MQQKIYHLYSLSRKCFIFFPSNMAWKSTNYLGRTYIVPMKILLDDIGELQYNIAATQQFPTKVKGRQQSIIFRGPYLVSTTTTTHLKICRFYYGLLFSRVVLKAFYLRGDLGRRSTFQTFEREIVLTTRYCSFYANPQTFLICHSVAFPMI